MAKHPRQSFVCVSAKQREELAGLLRRPTVAAGLAKRARAILLLAGGTSVSVVGRLVHMQRRHLYKWAERFRRLGVVGLHDGKRPGRPPIFSPRSRDASGQDCLRETG
jgi:transposase